MADQFCTKTHLDDIWGESGVLGRMDDNEDGSLSVSDLNRINRLIERASSRVASFLRFLPTARENWKGSNPPTDTPVSVAWMTAQLAAHFVSVHRGNPAPEYINRGYEQTLEDLEMIKTGDLKLDDIVYSLEIRPYLSNPVVHGAYGTAKIRIPLSTAVGGNPTGPIKRFIERNHYFDC